MDKFYDIPQAKDMNKNQKNVVEIDLTHTFDMLEDQFCDTPRTKDVNEGFEIHPVDDFKETWHHIQEKQEKHADQEASFWEKVWS